MKRKSLSHKLMKKLAVPIVATIFAIAIIGYLVALEEIDEVYDSELITAANVLWLVNRDDVTNPRTKVDLKVRNIDLEGIDQEALTEYAQWRAFRLWKGSKIVIASDNARLESVLPAKQGFEDFKQDGDRWRSFTLHIPEDDMIVEVAEKEDARLELVRNIAGSVIWPLLLVLPVIGILLWRGVYAGLGDLRFFTHAIRERAPDDMSKIDVEDTPTEIAPLGNALNNLLEKLEGSLVHERMFMDNAAHELRTPLAALRIQADLALTAKNSKEREKALHELIRGVERSAKLVDQMLMLGKTKLQFKPSVKIRFHDLLQQNIKLHVPLALKKHIDLSLTGDETLEGMSQPELLSTLLNNLLENAIKYTPEEGSVTADVSVHGRHPIITITDTGPGIPEAEREKVFDRFYRIADHAQAGSGLGLAIVRHIADMLEIQITLGTPEKGPGLRVWLLFPVQ